MKTFLSFLLLSFSLSAAAVANTFTGFDRCGFDQATVVFAQDETTEGGEDEDEEEPDCE